MMKKSLYLAAVCAFILFISVSADAAYIVNTGPGPNDQVGWSIGPAGATYYGSSLGAAFSVGTATTVTGIEGWMGSFSESLEATIAIYSDGGDIPGNELFSTAFHGGGNIDPLWLGASGLSWHLDPGTYWVTFEVRDGQTVSTNMPHPSETPLLNEAHTNAFSGLWVGADDLDIGVRISAVPIPPTIWLFGSTLALLGVARYKKA